MAETKNPAAEQEEEYPVDLITLEDEEGVEHTFEVLDALDHNDVHYMALVPYVTDENELLDEDLDLILMKVGNDAEGEFLATVEDEDELAQVGKLFQQRLESFFDIET